MPVPHTNRRGQKHHLHAGTTRTGKPRYWFSMKDVGDLAKAIPAGHEVYENPDEQVFLRKIVPQLVTPVDVLLVEDGLGRFASGRNRIVDVQEGHLVVHHAERVRLGLEDFGFGIRPLPIRYRDYMKVMRFTLVDEEARTYRVQRWCFRGTIDRWIDLPASGSEGRLNDLAKKSNKHINVNFIDHWRSWRHPPCHRGAVAPSPPAC